MIYVTFRLILSFKLSITYVKVLRLSPLRFLLEEKITVLSLKCTNYAQENFYNFFVKNFWYKFYASSRLNGSYFFLQKEVLGIESINLFPYKNIISI